MNNDEFKDCRIFGDSFFGFSGIMGGNMFGSSALSAYRIITILAGDAFSIDTGLYVDGGTALTKDILKYSGGTATTDY